MEVEVGVSDHWYVWRGPGRAPLGPMGYDEACRRRKRVDDRLYSLSERDMRAHAAVTVFGALKYGARTVGQLQRATELPEETVRAALRRLESEQIAFRARRYDARTQQPALWALEEQRELVLLLLEVGHVER